jgi:hypothetical protein
MRASNMTGEERPDRKLLLQRRNAQLVFFRRLRAKGLQDPEKDFTFLDFEEGGELLDRIITVRRGKAETKLPAREEAVGLAREWLQGHPGTVLCYVSNVGVLAGESKDYLLHFEFFEPLIESNMLFSTLSLDSAFECGEFEHCYHPVIW